MHFCHQGKRWLLGQNSKWVEVYKPLCVWCSKHTCKGIITLHNLHTHTHTHLALTLVSYLVPICCRYIIILRPQVRCCHYKVHVEITVIILKANLTPSCKQHSSLNVYWHKISTSNRPPGVSITTHTIMVWPYLAKKEYFQSKRLLGMVQSHHLFFFFIKPCFV